MLTLSSLGTQLAEQRKKLRLTQSELGRLASLSRATIDALENGRTGELGFSKITRILSALGLELSLQEARPRPALDDLMQENLNDKAPDRRG